jgi:predicted MFS family arabinose efflux permease
MSAATSKSEKIPGYTWVVMGIPWAIIVLGAVVTFAIGTMLGSMIDDLGFGPAQAGYLSSIGWFLTALLNVPLTTLVTKYSPKLVLSITFFAIAASLFVQAVSSNYTMLLISRAVTVALGVGVVPALTILKQQWIPLTGMTKVNGVEAFMNPAGQMVATAVVPFLLVWLAGWRPVLTALGVITAVVGVLWLVLGRERETEEYKAAVAEEEASGSPLRAAMKRKEIWLLAFGWPGTTLVWIAFFTFWPTFAVENLGLALTQAGPILSALPLGSMVASLVSPIICDKLGVEKPMIWIWGFILPLTYFAMLQTSNVALLTIFSFLTGFGAFAFVPPGLTLPYKLPGIKPREVAMGISIMMAIITAGGGLGPVIAGNIYESIGDLYMALAVCCLSPLTMGICGLFLPELGRKAMEKQAAEAAAS